MLQPALGSFEKPEMLFEVKDSEVRVDHFVSEEEQKRLDELAKLEEERKLRELVCLDTPTHFPFNSSIQASGL